MAKAKSFTVTTTVERTLAELTSYRAQGVHLPQALLILDSRNFHWLELQMEGSTTRIEAVRGNPLPDRHHEWEWPERFRVILGKQGQHSEREVERGTRGAGIYTLEICGVKPHELALARMMRRKRFVSFSYCVGRLTEVLAPTAVAEREEAL